MLEGCEVEFDPHTRERDMALKQKTTLRLM
jgi:hypothetical protein